MINIKITQETKLTNTLYTITTRITFTTYEEYSKFLEQLDEHMKKIFKIPKESIYAPNISTCWHKFDPKNRSTWPEIGCCVVITPDDPYALGTACERVVCLALDEHNALYWLNYYNCKTDKIYIEYAKYWREI